MSEVEIAAPNPPDSTETFTMANRAPKSSNVHGEVYPMKLCMLLLIRGINAGYGKFKLGTELEEEGGKFDDIIFKYKVDGTKRRRCIQAKHRLDGKGIIKLEDLMCDDGGNFSLPKYFRSYCDIKGDDIDDLVICTNYNVDTELIRNNHLFKSNEPKENKLLNDDDKIFGFKDQSGNPFTRRYKINKNESTLKESLQGSCGPIYELAKKLFDCAKNGNQMDQSKDEIFKKHHVTLIDEKVIDPQTKWFHQDFIHDTKLSEDARRLRRVILNMSKSSEWMKPKANKPRKLELGQTFGMCNGGDKILPNNSSLAKKLFDCAKNGTKLDEADGIFKDHHTTLVRQKVIDRSTKQFHKDFAKDTPTALSADALRLHEAFVSWPKKQKCEISTLWEKELNLGQNFGIGCERIPDYSADDMVVNEFLDKFVLAITPHEAEMGPILMKELDDFSKHKLLNQDFQLSYFLDKIMNWFKKKREESKDSWMTSESCENEILKEIDFLVDCFHIDGISLKHRDELLKILKFHDNEIKNMKVTLKPWVCEPNGENLIQEFLEKFVPKPHETGADETDETDEIDLSKHELLNRDFPWVVFLDRMLNLFKKKMEESKDSDGKTAVEGNKEILKKIDSLIEIKKNEEILDAILEKELDKHNLKNQELNDMLDWFKKKREKSRMTSVEIQTPSPVKICANKVISALKTMEVYKKDDSFLVVSANDLQKDERWKRVFLEADGFHHLLVVICETSEVSYQDEWSSWIPSPNIGEKKLVVIREMIDDRKGENVREDVAITYDQLSDEEKKNVQSKTISFQGVETRISDLIASGSGNSNGGQQQQNSVLDSNSLTELLLMDADEIPIQNSKEIRLQQLENPNYIERPIQWILRSNSLRFWNKVAENLNCTEEELRKICEWGEKNKKIKWLVKDKKQIALVWEAISKTTFEMKSQSENPLYIKRKIRRWVGPKAEDATQFWKKVAENLIKRKNAQKKEKENKVNAEEVKRIAEQLTSECSWVANSYIINWNQHNTNERNSEILKAISETNNYNFEEINEGNFVDSSNPSVAVISGVAGTGKSTILSHIYEEIKLREPNQLVIRIDLINHCELIKNIDKQVEITDFFVKHFADFSLENRRFAEWLLTQRLKRTGNVTFLLDGFDEISSELQNKTIELIKALRETKAETIYVTTRSHMNEKLENEFHQFAFSLLNFTMEDQISFITNYWKENYLKEDELKKKNLGIEWVDASNEISKGVKDGEINEMNVNVERLAKFLTNKVSENLKDEEREFVGIPLQCRILAECFESQLKEALQNKESFDSLFKEIEGATFDLVGLYRRLMETKRIIYCQEKIKSNPTTDSLVESSVQERIEFLRTLAIDTIVESKEDAAILLGHSRNPRFESHNEKQKRKILHADLGLRFGLLNKTNQGKLEFLHRTYAEYLVAEFIYKGFHLDDDEHNQLLNSKAARNLLVEKIFKNDLYEGVMRFFNCMLKSFVEFDNWRRIMKKNDNERKEDLPKRWKLMVELIYNVEKDEGDFSKTTLLYLAMKRNFASFFIFTCDCLVHFFYRNLEQLTSAFKGKFKTYINYSFQYKEKTSSAMFQKLLSIYKASPRDICSYIFDKMKENMKDSLKSRNYKNLPSCWNNEEKRKTIKFALEFLTKHKFIPEKPIDDTYPIIKFFFRNEYYDDVITSLLDYLLVFEDDTITAEILQLAFRRYSCRQHWKRGRNEFVLKQIVEFFKTKGRSDLINKGLHREILVLGEEKHKREILPAMRDQLTPFYVAAACGYENDCLEILKQRGNYSKCKPFLLKALGDAILFKKNEMFRLTLEAIKKIFSLNGLEYLLQSDMSKLVECYRHRKKRRKNATVFVVIDDEEMFNKMIGIFVGDGESLEQRDRLTKLFLQNESTSNKIALLSKEHLQLLFPADKFKDWLNYVMNVNIEFGFRLIPKLLMNIPDYLELLKIITQTDGNQSGSSYWNQWFQKNSELDDCDRIKNLGELLVGISSSLGVEELTEKLLLHDDGYAIACGLWIDGQAVERAFDSVTNLKDEFAKKWIQHLPGVLERVSSQLHYFNSRVSSKHVFKLLEFILPMMKYASDDQLSKFVNVILEKNIWYYYIAIKTTGVEIPDQFLKLVSTKLGDSELEKLVFHRFVEMLAEIVECRIIYHDYIDMLLSHFKGDHREKIGRKLIKLPHRFDEYISKGYMNIFPMLVKYSDEKHLKKFVDNIIKCNTFERKEPESEKRRRREERWRSEWGWKDSRRYRDGRFKQKQGWEDERMVEYESSIWTEFLRSTYNLYGIKPDLVASILKWTSENLGNDYIEKLILHEDGRIITRVLLWQEEDIVNAVLNHVPIEFCRKIAKHFMKNALEEFQDPENEELSRFNKINTLFLPFLKKHAESQELVKFFNDTFTQGSNKWGDSIWIEYLRKCVKNQEMDKVEEFWSFLSQNVDANEVCNWMCAFIRDLADIALNGKDDKFVKLLINQFQSNDYKKFWHDLIERQLNNTIDKCNWFYLLPQFQHNADANQLGKLIKIITHRCDPGKSHREYNKYIAHEADQKTDMKKWSIWSYYINYDDRCTSITIDKLLNCVRATKELGPSKVKELVLHSPNEGDDDPVVVRAATNGETDVVEAMLRYLSIEDRKEVEQQIEAALNLEK